MQLIGMLDSPYVRRVAVSLQLLGLPFEHRSVSVFSTFAQFQAINPVVKAPSLVCDDGSVLMDSSLILDYAESLAAPQSLMGVSPAERQHILRLTGLALAACEKSVQIIYERQLRPAEKQHAPWISRVTGQLLAAYEALESECRQTPLADGKAINQAGVSVAVAWHFTQQMLPEVVAASAFPALQQFSGKAEALQAFAAAPHGAGTYRQAGSAARNNGAPIDVQIQMGDTLAQAEVLELYIANGWSAAQKPSQLMAALQNSHSLVTARVSTQLVGLGNAISDGHLVVYYPHMLVHPDYQRQGIGKKMMQAMQARYAGFHQQMLTADGGAVDFYRSLGFERAGKTEPMWVYAGSEH